MVSSCLGGCTLTLLLVVTPAGISPRSLYPGTSISLLGGFGYREVSNINRYVFPSRTVVVRGRVTASILLWVGICRWSGLTMLHGLVQVAPLQDQLHSQGREGHFLLVPTCICALHRLTRQDHGLGGGRGSAAGGTMSVPPPSTARSRFGKGSFSNS